MGRTHHPCTSGASCSGKALTVDLEALFAELSALPADQGESYTTLEVMERIGRGKEYTRALIAKAQAAGRCRVVNKVIPTLSGRRTTVAAYVFG